MKSETFHIHVVGVDRSFPCREGESVLTALAPIHRLKIDSGCRGGGCGVCKIAVVAGEAERGKMSAAHVSTEDEAEGKALACKLFPRSDLTVEVLERKIYRFGT